MKILDFFLICGSFLPSWIRIRIQQLKLMRFHADPNTDPKPWVKTDELSGHIKVRGSSQHTDYWTHRVDRVLGFFPVVKIGTPTFHPQASVSPPPLIPVGVDTLARGRGGRKSQFGRGDRHCSTLGIVGTL
jgi:hypothetical protein